MPNESIYQYFTFYFQGDLQNLEGVHPCLTAAWPLADTRGNRSTLIPMNPKDPRIRQLLKENQELRRDKEAMFLVLQDIYAEHQKIMEQFSRYKSYCAELTELAHSLIENRQACEKADNEVKALQEKLRRLSQG